MQAIQGDEEPDPVAMNELGEAVVVLQGAASMAHGILQVCHANPPENLLTVAAALHDNCLLVRQHWNFDQPSPNRSYSLLPSTGGW